MASQLYTHIDFAYTSTEILLFSLVHIGDITISYHCQYPLILMALKLYRLLATNENIASCGDISKPPTIYIPRFISHRIETSIYVLLYLFFFLSINYIFMCQFVVIVVFPVHRLVCQNFSCRIVIRKPLFSS